MEGDVWLEPEEDRWQRRLQTTSFQLALEPPRLVFLQFGGLGWEVVDEEGIWRGSDVSVNHGGSSPAWQVRWHWRWPCRDLAEFLLLQEPLWGPLPTADAGDCPLFIRGAGVRVIFES